VTDPHDQARAVRDGLPRWVANACRAGVANFASWMVAFFVGSAPEVFAADLVDYRVENTEWNGLSSAALVARELGVALVQSRDVDLDVLGPHDVLLLIHPEGDLPVDALVRFVAEGGRLIVADDFGTSGALVASFGLVHLASAGASTSVFMNNLNLPIFQPLGRHPLSDGVNALITNHPTSLRGDGSPVFAYASGEGLVYDMSLGDGRAIFLADPSVWINLMLPLGDNRQFFENVLAHACAETPCRVWVMSGDGFSISYTSSVSQSRMAFDEWVDDLRAFMEDLRDGDLDDRALYFASILLLAGTVLIALLVFPQRRPSWIQRPTRVLRTMPAGEFEFCIHRYLGRFGERTYALPSALLREIFDALFYKSLGLQAPPEDHPNPREVREVAARRFVERHTALHGRAARRRERAVLRVLHSVARVPQRGAVSLVARSAVTKREFVHLHRSIRETLELMGHTDEFNRRINNPR